MIIYKQYSQEQLNNQYNNRLHVPDFATCLARWENRSVEVREKHAFIKDVAYGDHSRETLDIFPCSTVHSKVLVYIHGGYWQMFDKSMFHFMAETFLPHNITTVLINYPLAPAATVDNIVASCGRAVLWLQQNLPAFNADPNEIYLAGHSAGAHLAAMLLSNQYPGSINHFIKGICLISGLFDLHPIQLSYLNEVLQMDKAMAIRNSPIDLLPAQTCPLLIAVGATETQEFKYQSQVFYNACKGKAPSVEWLELEGRNHFSVVDSLADENGLLHKATIRMMGV
jgi:arylformamidase